MYEHKFLWLNSFSSGNLPKIRTALGVTGSPSAPTWSLEWVYAKNVVTPKRANPKRFLCIADKVVLRWSILSIVVFLFVSCQPRISMGGYKTWTGHRTGFWTSMVFCICARTFIPLWSVGCFAFRKGWGPRLQWLPYIQWGDHYQW